MVFVAKMEFTHKSRYVATRFHAPKSDEICYVGFFSHESVYIFLNYADLGIIDIMSADIQNVYFTALFSEKYWTRHGTKFGSVHEGKKVIIVQALFGLLCAGKNSRDLFHNCMKHLGFQSCPADPDFWLCPSIHSNGDPYYDYILLYIGDCLCVRDNRERVLMDSENNFMLNSGSNRPPNIYLGGKVSNVVFTNVV